MQTPFLTSTESRQIPAALGAPLLRHCARADRPPIPTHSDVALNNWRLSNSSLPPSLDNASTLFNFSETPDESWFLVSAVDVEARGAAITSILPDLFAHRDANDLPALAKALHAVADALAAMAVPLDRMAEGCRPHVFYSTVRPFLQGTSGLDPPLRYEGLPSPPPAMGGSAAQSSLLQVVDAVLGVAHADSYLEMMRSYVAV